MPRNLQEQIERIIKLSAEGYSQREVERVLVVSQGGVIKILPHNRDTGRPYHRRHGGRRSLATAWDRQLIRMVKGNHFILAPGLCVEMIHWFRRRLSVRSIVNRFLAMAIHQGDPPCAPDWLWITGDDAVCVGEHTEGGTSGYGDTVSSVTVMLCGCVHMRVRACVHMRMCVGTETNHNP